MIDLLLLVSQNRLLSLVFSRSLSISIAFELALMPVNDFRLPFNLVACVLAAAAAAITLSEAAIDADFSCCVKLDV